ncbi:MAG TPA: acireductone synthase [Gammaproteobacteria bacterium]|nr:acireductone synthase [Gammaproteobacteria bacterium]
MAARPALGAASRGQLGPGDASVRVVLLDIEGTTTPIAFVHAVLFPYAARALPAFLEGHAFDSAVAADIALLAHEYAAEKASGNADLPPWDGASGAAGAIPYLQYLMRQDRKSTALKSLQGRVWEMGYRTGELVGQLFEDVAPSLAGWHAAGLRLAIFSSGSIHAQQLLFRHSEAGDLTPYLAGYFDTRSGPKREASSYRCIAQAMEVAPEAMLFVSDVAAELDAARAAGCATALSVRPGNAPVEGTEHPRITSLGDLGL